MSINSYLNGLTKKKVVVMGFLKVLLRYVKLISFYAHKLVGFDSLTGLKISGRDDLKKLGSNYGG